MNHKPQVGIGVLIFNSKKEILLGKRIGSHGAYTWAPPGGHLEFGESFEECARREVLEETNLIIKNPKFFAVTNDFFKQENKHYISIFMKVVLKETGPILKNLEPHKNEVWQWFNILDLPENLFPPLKQVKINKHYGAEINNDPKTSF